MRGAEGQKNTKNIMAENELMQKRTLKIKNGEDILASLFWKNIGTYNVINQYFSPFSITHKIIDHEGPHRYSCPSCRSTRCFHPEKILFKA